MNLEVVWHGALWRTVPPPPAPKAGPVRYGALKFLDKPTPTLDQILEQIDRCGPLTLGQLLDRLPQLTRAAVASAIDRAQNMDVLERAYRVHEPRVAWAYRRKEQ